MAQTCPYFRLIVTSEVAKDYSLADYVDEYCGDDQYAKVTVEGATLIMRVPSPEAARKVLPFILAYGKPINLSRPRKVLAKAGLPQPLLDLNHSHHVAWLELPGTYIVGRLEGAGASVIGKLVAIHKEELARKTGLDGGAISLIKMRLDAYGLNLAGS